MIARAALVFRVGNLAHKQRHPLRWNGAAAADLLASWRERALHRPGSSMQTSPFAAHAAVQLAPFPPLYQNGRPRRTVSGWQSGSQAAAPTAVEWRCCGGLAGQLARMSSASTVSRLSSRQTTQRKAQRAAYAVWHAAASSLLEVDSEWRASAIAGGRVGVREGHTRRALEGSKRWEKRKPFSGPLR
eukprot:CAMPEP_0119098424 /NCGR_PEP_ID=MMETSP1178-20130426/184581_1 /TAXON_ID=33656 /ORGANISM="unid sp, Strain CCMP2000" /LENGTH=186 /DNA_ID=CAMNT_0007082401 /DNA_START=331 /DNA_END=888 /DNA_ORIENTATION=-